MPDPIFAIVKRSPRLLGSAASLLLWLHAVAADGVNLSGRWSLEFQRDASSVSYVADCVWEQEGDRLSGRCASGFESIVTVHGRVEQSDVTFEFKAGTDGPVMAFSGRLDEKAASLSGTWQSVDDQGNTGGGTFTAKKR